MGLVLGSLIFKPIQGGRQEPLTLLGGVGTKRHKIALKAMLSAKGEMRQVCTERKGSVYLSLDAGEESLPGEF